VTLEQWFESCVIAPIDPKEPDLGSLTIRDGALLIVYKEATRERRSCV
jgi:hypothetical protein